MQCYRPQTAGPRAQTAPRWVRLVRLCVAVTVAVEVCLWFVFLRCTVLVSKFVIICVSTSICIIIIYFIHARLTWILFSWICWEIFTGYISKHFFFVQFFGSDILCEFINNRLRHLKHGMTSVCWTSRLTEAMPSTRCFSCCHDSTVWVLCFSPCILLPSLALDGP